MSKRKRKQVSVCPPVDLATQESHLASFRARLARIRTDPLMGQLAPTLLRMLDAGQIICQYDIQDGGQELVFAAKITPAEIRELLPLVSHPVPYSTLRFFLEGMVNIVAEDGGNDALAFCNTEYFLQLPEHALGDAIYRSGVEDPDWLASAMMRAASETAVAEAIGFPVVPSADGWIYPRIGHQTIGVKLIQTSDDLLSFPTVADFIDDIVVVALPVAATQTVHLIGWLDMETFRSEHSRQQRDGNPCCVLPHETLFRCFQWRPWLNSPELLPFSRRNERGRRCSGVVHGPV